MADTPLFNLDVGGRYRLAYDANQWTYERGPPLLAQDRPRIHLTPEARFRFDALPDTFRAFQSMAVQSTAAA